MIYLIDIGFRGHASGLDHSLMYRVQLMRDHGIPYRFLYVPFTYNGSIHHYARMHQIAFNDIVVPDRLYFGLPVKKPSLSYQTVWEQYPKLGPFPGEDQRSYQVGSQGYIQFVLEEEHVALVQFFNAERELVSEDLYEDYRVGRRYYKHGKLTHIDYFDPDQERVYVVHAVSEPTGFAYTNGEKDIIFESTDKLCDWYFAQNSQPDDLLFIDRFAGEYGSFYDQFAGDVYWYVHYVATEDSDSVMVDHPALGNIRLGDTQLLTYPEDGKPLRGAICPTVQHKAVLTDYFERMQYPDVEIQDIYPVGAEHFGPADTPYDATSRRFMTVTNFTKNKRFNLILDFMRGIGPDYYLDVYGDGKQIAQYQAEVDSDLLLRGRVHFHGYVDRIPFQDALGYLSFADTECGSVAVLEAVHYGIPVIGLNRPYIVPEVTAEGAGIIGETVEELIEQVRPMTGPDFGAYHDRLMQAPAYRKLQQTTNQYLTLLRREIDAAE